MSFWLQDTIRAGDSIVYRLDGEPKDSVDQDTWRTVLEGNGFSAGEAGSNSSLILFVVPKETTDETRTELLTAVCSVWVETAGCHKNDLMISAFDDNLLS